MTTRTRADADAARAAWSAGHVPVGKSGPWEVSRLEVTQEASEMDSLRALINGHMRYARPGTVTQLLRNGTVVMSDTVDEMHDHYPLRRRTGRLLVNGLGLGCGLRLALASPGVTHVDVVEVSSDVLALVGPSLADYGDLVTLHHADAFTIQWPVGTRWDYAWHDVWDDISTDNLRGPGSYAALHRKYGRRVDAQGSWAFELARYYDRRGG